MTDDTAASTPVVILATAPDERVAAELARMLVEGRHAACVGRLPGLLSVYRWEGAVEEAQEVQLLIKTVKSRLPGLREAFEAAHPYEVPELLVLDVSDGAEPYLRWLAEATEPA